MSETSAFLSAVVQHLLVLTGLDVRSIAAAYTALAMTAYR
jgi:hypothetical protein